MFNRFDGVMPCEQCEDGNAQVRFRGALVCRLCEITLIKEEKDARGTNDYDYDLPTFNEEETE